MAKLNAEVDTTTAKHYRVGGYPTIMVLNENGEELDRVVGYYRAPEFMSQVEDYIAGRNTLASMVAEEAAGKNDPEFVYKLADRDKQTYVYFIVRQDGKYMIKHRAGTAVHTIVDWKDSPAIQKPDASGKMTNTLTVEAKGPDLKYFINGTQVERQDHAHVGGDGVVGVRVNHNLDVHIADFALKPVK